MFVKWVNVVVCGIWLMNLFEGVEGIYIGNFVCGVVLVWGGVGYIVFGDYLMLIFVMGGS